MAFSTRVMQTFEIENHIRPLDNNLGSLLLFLLTYFRHILLSFLLTLPISLSTWSSLTSSISAFETNCINTVYVIFNESFYFLCFYTHNWWHFGLIWLVNFCDIALQRLLLHTKAILDQWNWTEIPLKQVY